MKLRSMRIPTLSMMSLQLLLALNVNSTELRSEWNTRLMQADSLRKEANYPAARDMCEAVWSELTAEALNRDTLAAYALQILGDCERRQGDLTDAKSLIEQSKDIYSALLPGSDPRIARNLNSLGAIAQSAGNMAEAERLYQESLDIRLSAYGEEHPDVAQSYCNLAAVAFSVGDFTRADEYYRQALRINECTIGRDHSDFAFALSGVAMTSEQLGRFGEATELYMEALDLRSRLLGPNHPDLASTRMNLAILLLNQGYASQALSYAREACDMYRRSAESDKTLLASALNNLAIILQEMGRFEESLPILEEADELSETAGSSAAVARRIAILSNRANVAIWRGDLEEAEQLYRNSLTLANEILGVDDVGYAICVANLGILLRNYGRCEEADSLYQLAIRVMRDYYDIDQPECTKLRTVRAEALLCRELYIEATSELALVQADVLHTLGPHHPDFAAVSSLLAYAQGQCGDHTAAVKNAVSAWEIRATMLNVLLPALAEKSALVYSEEFLFESSCLLSALMDARQHGVDTMDLLARAIVSSKGRVTEGMLSRRCARGDHPDLVAQALLDSLNALRVELSNHYVMGAERDPESFDTTLTALSTRMTHAEQAYAERFGVSSNAASISTDRHTLRQSLPDRSMLIDYVKYDHRTKGLDSESKYLAMVLTPFSADVYDLGPAVIIDSLVRNYRGHMARDHGLDYVEFAETARSLYKALWKPVEDQARSSDLIIVAPDAALHYVSFASLINEQGRYLIEEYALRYCGTARDLLDTSRASGISGSGLLAIGDVNYDGFCVSDAMAAADSVQPSADIAWNLLSSRGPISSCGGSARMSALPLPATRDEVLEVAESWAKSHNEPVTVLLGTDANEHAVKLNCSGRRILHFATHGYALADSCAPAGKLRSGERTLLNPLLLSGLLLAGCNRATSLEGYIKNEDGVLTSEEIAGMDLRGTELVILSACETGLGELRDGEGMFGPTRAFRMAGARRVVSALWRVDDRATAAIMQKIMEAEDVPIEYALRDAMLDAIRTLRADGRSDHPYYWAGFTVFGGGFDRR